MKALLASILAATLSSAALSATISFPNNPQIPDPPPGSSVIAENFTDTGFRFSPSCHLDFLYVIDCRGEFNNDNYLGPSGPGGDFGSLYVDFFGKPFSLISLLPAQGSPCDGCAGHFNMDLYSSRGGFVSFSDETEMFFTGDEWRNLTWLVIANNFADSPATGASNFVVSIPEPATHALIAVALVGLAFIRRRAMQ
jgi:hypothetical protein